MIRRFPPKSPGDSSLAPAVPTIRFAQHSSKAGFRALVALQTLQLLSRLGFCGLLAIFVGHLVMERDVSGSVLGLSAIALILTIALSWATEWMRARSEIHVSIDVRNRMKRELAAKSAHAIQAIGPGNLILSLQRHPEAIAALVIGHRAARMMMAIGPLVAAAILMCLSWRAGLAMLLLTPILIVCFALVGHTIRKRAEAQEQALGHLAGQFADRIRVLPTILANHAVGAERAKLSTRLETYATQTMRVLQIAFINAGIIDFFSSLSIGCLAVLLGLGHLKLAMIPGFGSLELWQSLFILTIAPEYFAPFRRYAEQYHAKAEGLAAAAAVDRMRQDTAPPQAVLPEVDTALSGLRLPAHGLLAIVGQSGAGKSTFLRRLAGVEAADHTTLRLQRPSVWVAPDSFVPEGTLAEAVSWGLSDISDSGIKAAVEAVGLFNAIALPDGLNTRLASGGSNLSGGQRLRLTLARAILANGSVVADEPTAKLDSTTGAMVRAVLADISRTRLVIVATHDPELVRAADNVIELSHKTLREMAA